MASLKASLTSLIVLPMVTSCASAGVLPSPVTGNEQFVTVSNVWGVDQAMPKAEAHCATYGRVPKFTRMDGYRASFECVPKGS